MKKEYKMSFVDVVGKDKARARAESRKSKAQAKAKALRKSLKYKLTY